MMEVLLEDYILSGDKECLGYSVALAGTVGGKPCEVGKEVWVHCCSN